MALMALLFAIAPDDQALGVRGLVDIGGWTVVERAAHQAFLAGATRILVRVDSPDHAAHVEAMAAHGLPVVVAFDAATVASAVTARDQLLVIAEGVVADARLIETVAHAGGGQPGDGVLAAWPVESSPPPRALRVDSQWVSAGVARLPGVLARKTAHGLGDWDLEETLFLAAAQDGSVQRLNVEQVSRSFVTQGEPPLGWSFVTRASDGAAAALHTLAQVPAWRRDLVSLKLLRPLALHLAYPLSRVGVGPTLALLSAGLVAGLATVLAGLGWVLTAALVMIAALGLEALAAPLRALRSPTGESPPPRGWAAGSIVVELMLWTGVCVGAAHSNGAAGAALALFGLLGLARLMHETLVAIVLALLGVRALEMTGRGGVVLARTGGLVMGVLMLALGALVSPFWALSVVTLVATSVAVVTALWAAGLAQDTLAASQEGEYS